MNLGGRDPKKPPLTTVKTVHQVDPHTPEGSIPGGRDIICLYPGLRAQTGCPVHTLR
jgi:hypothetical protein